MDTALSLVGLPVADGTLMDAVVVQPTEPGPWPGIIYPFESYGLTDHMVQRATETAAQGYVVIVPDLYHRQGRLRTAPYWEFQGSWTIQPYPDSGAGADVAASARRVVRRPGRGARSPAEPANRSSRSARRDWLLDGRPDRVVLRDAPTGDQSPSPALRCGGGLDQPLGRLHPVPEPHRADTAVRSNPGRQHPHRGHRAGPPRHARRRQCWSCRPFGAPPAPTKARSRQGSASSASRSRSTSTPTAAPASTTRPCPAPTTPSTRPMPGSGRSRSSRSTSAARPVLVQALVQEQVEAVPGSCPRLPRRGARCRSCPRSTGSRQPR